MEKSAGSETPQRLGDFEIIRQIGRGGMGVVYEARQRSLKRPVALKVLSNALGLTEKAVTRFRREAAAAAKLHHTNTVPIYATGEDRGVHYYAMELIDGPSLDDVIRKMRGANKAPGSSTTDTTIDPNSSALPEWVSATIAYDWPQGAGDLPSRASMGEQPSGYDVASGTKHFDTVAMMVAESLSRSTEELIRGAQPTDRPQAMEQRKNLNATSERLADPSSACALGAAFGQSANKTDSLAAVAQSPLRANSRRSPRKRRNAQSQYASATSPSHRPCVVSANV
jgi:hypothetical protein